MPPEIRILKTCITCKFNHRKGTTSKTGSCCIEVGGPENFLFVHAKSRPLPGEGHFRRCKGKLPTYEEWYNRKGLKESMKKEMTKSLYDYLYKIYSYYYSNNVNKRRTNWFTVCDSWELKPLSKYKWRLEKILTKEEKDLPTLKGQF